MNREKSAPLHQLTGHHWDAPSETGKRDRLKWFRSSPPNRVSDYFPIKNVWGFLCDGARPHTAVALLFLFWPLLLIILCSPLDTNTFPLKCRRSHLCVTVKWSTSSGSPAILTCLFQQNHQKIITL